MNLNIIGDWVRSLDIKVHKPEATSNIPARLIDLHTCDGLRIVNTADAVQNSLQFAALSYVWGMNQKFILLTENVRSLMSSFELNQLPQTIQDAITTTRHVGIRYTWVDALCIIQDSTEDKARELPKMRFIYKNAAITLVAAVAESATDGFLHHVEDPHYSLNPIRIPYQDKVFGQPPAEVVLSWPSEYQGFSDPINSRAWTYQEFLLSIRAIVFSYGGIAMIGRTDRPDKNGLTSGRDSDLTDLPWNDLLLSLGQSEDPRQTWLKLRQEYSSRHLSYLLDKLSAISAVAEEFGHTNAWTYRAGLWEHELADDLQWSSLSFEDVSTNSVTLTPRPKDYIAPSWSWASVDARVTASVFPAPEAASKSSRVFKGYFDFKGISSKVELAVAGFEYGPVSSGLLTVRGRLCSLIWQPYPESRFHSVPQIQEREEDGYLEMLSGGKGRKGGAIIDAFDPELHKAIEVTCLATRIAEEKLDGGYKTEGLMLLPVNAGEKRYRRVGFFRMDELAMFERVQIETLSII